MQIEVSSNPVEKVSSDVIISFVFEDKKSYAPTESFIKLDKALASVLSQTLKLESFTGKEGSSVTVFTHGKILSPRVMVVGLGKKEEFTPVVLRKIIAGVIKKLNKATNSVSVELPTDDIGMVKMLAQGFLLGNYKFTQYLKKDPAEKELEAIIIAGVLKASQKEYEKEISEATLICNAIRLTRDLVNEQAAVATPTYLAKVAQDIAKANPEITVKIYDKKECEKMGMEAFLGIARASVDVPPRFIHLEYTPKGYKGDKKVALIGKGITFDTGGISIKPEKYMADMKMDMAGAAAVLGVFSIISHFKPNVPVMGLIAATPNLISGSSLVPGDVVRAMNGKTIEILNTDAEGRVTLADSMSYATKNGATEMIDLATLTGACMVALGTDYAGLFSNNKSLTEKVMKAAIVSGEKVWELPLPAEYKKLNKSEVADISNLASSMWGGAVTAALFLQEFVDNKPWVHLDIAGPAFAEGESELGPKGGTGFGVGLLISYLSML